MNRENENEEQSGNNLNRSSRGNESETTNIINHTILEVLRNLVHQNLSQNSIFEPENVYVNFTQHRGENTTSSVNPLSVKIIKKKSNTVNVGESSNREVTSFNITPLSNNNLNESNETNSERNAQVSQQFPETEFGSRHHDVATQSVNNLGRDVRHDTSVQRSYSDQRLSLPPVMYHGPPPLAGAPPTYSTIIQSSSDDNPWLPLSMPQIRVQPSPPFIPPVPPPSYNEAQGFHLERPIIVASDQLTWGPNPLSVICPRCAHVVLTRTETRRSNLTHFSALALCLCGCWPCCLIPYCLDSCKNTYHRCPTCQQLLGTYRPCSHAV